LPRAEPVEARLHPKQFSIKQKKRGDKITALFYLLGGEDEKVKMKL
jgi:hypothetical protein